jgi:small conductance mechanosensitive channel
LSIQPFLAQTTTTTVPGEIEVVEPSRPITDWLIELFELDPDGYFSRLMSSILEPAIQIVLTLLIAWVVLRLGRRIGRRVLDRAKTQQVRGVDIEFGMASRKSQRLEALSAVSSSLFGFVVWTAAVLVILGNTFGINLTPFLAGAGIIGIALGFGAQDLVKDFMSGIFMLIEDQYGVGDVIDVGDATGTVEKISLRSTRLRDATGTVWHFPNGEIRRVGNMRQEWSRALLDVTIGYGSDIDLASEIIRKAADDMAKEEDFRGRFLDKPEVWGVESVSPDGVVLRLVIKTLPGEQWGLSRELRRRIKVALDEGGIEVPPSQRSLWLRQEGDNPGTPSETG